MSYHLLGSVLLVAIIACALARNGKNNTLYLGNTGAWTGPFAPDSGIACGFILGLETIKERKLLPGYEFEYQVRDSHCNNRQGMKNAIDLWDSMDDLDVIFGDSCSVVCQPLGLLGAAWNIPIISNFCTSDALSNTRTYPTFSRVISGYVRYLPVISKVALTFNFNRVVIITEPVDVYTIMAEFGKEYMESQGQTVIYKVVKTTVQVENGKEVLISENLERLRKLLRELKHQTRFFLVLLYLTNIRHFLILCHEEGMLNGDYVFHATDMYPANSPNPLWRPELTDTFLYQGYLAMDVAVNIKDFKQFQNDCYQYAHLPAFDAVERPQNPESISKHAAMKHDAVLMWAIAVNKTLEQGYAADDGLHITKNILNLTFQGMTGSVIIDEKGDRYSDFVIEIMQNGRSMPILEWRAAEQRMVKRYKPENETDWSGIMWSGNATDIPSNSPPCGWKGELCPEGKGQSVPTIAGVTSTIAFVFVFAVAASIVAKKYLYESKLKEAATYILPWEATEVIQAGTKHRSTSRVTVHSSVSVETFATHHIETVRINNDLAAVKKLGLRVVDFADRDVLSELRQIKDTKHDNINIFLGVCLEVPNACIFMQYAQRGSLEDVLASDEIKLTWDFKLSIANDIASGMKFLHSTDIAHHGHLTSRNCVIDGRWVCKVTDHGLNYLRLVSGLTDRKNTTCIDDCNLWTAPEILKHRAQGNESASKQGDVYSFGIIVQEIILEGPPYCKNCPVLERSDIIQRVKSSETPPYRPTVNKEVGDNHWTELMRDCWHENHSERPSFRRITEELMEINGGEQLNLVDNMIQRLENHAQNLEGIVHERTQALHDEKQKVEHLLQELLPHSVANDLKAGHQIQPESFDDVTIFFSDIVSFTRISAAGTPIDVVRMLNLMYTMFDDVSAQFDVYKVATIGDAYFVASGVPIRNGNKHAIEISKMALKLLESVANFQIPHLPSETLKLRIGIHSGPCVAGVAGVKMPRYLLFGDTVDIASRMESQGESMLIHISQVTCNHLVNTKLFIIEERGELQVKGLGHTTTYWLKKCMT